MIGLASTRFRRRQMPMQAPASSGATEAIHQGLEALGDSGSDAVRASRDSGTGTTGSGCGRALADGCRARGALPAVVRLLWRAEAATMPVLATSPPLEPCSGTVSSSGRADRRTTAAGTTAGAAAGAAGSAAAAVTGAAATGSAAGAVTDAAGATADVVDAA
jgi:hypothetical protein